MILGNEKSKYFEKEKGNFKIISMSMNFRSGDISIPESSWWWLCLVELVVVEVGGSECSSPCSECSSPSPSLGGGGGPPDWSFAGVCSLSFLSRAFRAAFELQISHWVLFP